MKRNRRRHFFSVFQFASQRITLLVAAAEQYDGIATETREPSNNRYGVSGAHTGSGGGAAPT
jgi:hypothetical protein